MFEHYLQKADFRNFLTKLDSPCIEMLIKNIEYFTEKEAEKRDEIVKGYFGEVGITTIVNEVTKNLKKMGKGLQFLMLGLALAFSLLN